MRTLPMLLALATLLLVPTALPAQSGPAIVLFADRPMSVQLWTAITASLNDSLAPGTAASHSGSFQILRGDTLPLGIEVAPAMTVYLHGDCTLPIRTTIPPGGRIAGALGWVLIRDGQIEPFAHVDCNLIGQIIRRRAIFLTPEQQPQAMPNAIARVVLHEFVHIHTQSAYHAKHGLTKAEFTADDLVQPIPQMRAESRRFNPFEAPTPSSTRPATGR